MVIEILHLKNEGCESLLGFFDAFLFLCERSLVSLRTTGFDCFRLAKTNLEH